MTRLILSILACLLFPTSFWICEVFFSDNINLWDVLRHCLYCLSIITSASLYLFKENERYEPWVKFFNCVLIGMLTAKITDNAQLIFEFKLTDLIFIAATAIFGYIKYIHGRRKIA